MASLRKRGCRFLLDDFGSGLSAYHNLKPLPVDYLKIDGNFVSKMDEDPIDDAMVAAIQRIAQLMGIQTIAECAESDSTLRRLRGMGIQHAQGNALERPKPFAAITSAAHEHEMHLAVG
jgi:EAL domain-containing protein (putative c-di-GMP-specific phosphodiesterase class I)